MYKVNMEIPGWNGLEILYELAKLAAKVPESGNILEMGALFGRTSYVLGHNKPADAKLFVIDCWPDIMLKDHEHEFLLHDRTCGDSERELLESFFKKDPDRLEGEDFHKLWSIFVESPPNTSSSRTLTSCSTDDYPMIDLMIHDAGHDYSSVYDDLVHWFPKLKQDGILVVDDYENEHFPDLVKAVDRFVEENNLKTEMLTPRNIIIRR